MPKGIFKKRIKDLLKHLNIKTKNTAIYLISKDFDSKEDCGGYLDGYMYYLSGIDIPNMGYLYNITTHESILFRDTKKHKSLSHQYSDSELSHKFQIDNILPQKSKKKILARYSKVYKLADLKLHLNKMRLIKTPTEINDIKNVCLLTSQALNNIIRNIKLGDHESHIEKQLAYQADLLGMNHKAFPSIIASGPNATILHYNRNNSKLKNGDLMILDVGFRIYGYCSDISRTIPVNGVFTEMQRKIYNGLLKIQKTIINMTITNNTFNNLQYTCNQMLYQLLIDMKILQSGTPSHHKKTIVRTFMPHNIGHSIGLDVHDPVDDYGTLILKTNMALTIEPGIYFNKEIIKKLPPNIAKYINLDVIQKFRKNGVHGIRIEDVVLIKGTKNQVLTKNITKEIDGIEHLMLSKK